MRRIKALLKTLYLLMLLTAFTQAYAQESSNLNRRKLLIKKPIQHEKGKVKVAFFDADGTLRITKSGQVAPNVEDDIFILPNVREKIEELKAQGYFIALASNQGGVDRGYLSIETADKALLNTIRMIDPENELISYFDFAEEYKRGPNVKPATGMAERLNVFLANYGMSIDLENSIMVGDAGSRDNDFSDSDRKFAENFGISFIHARDFFEWSKAIEKTILDHSIAQLRCEKLLSVGL